MDRKQADLIKEWQTPESVAEMMKSGTQTLPDLITREIDLLKWTQDLSTLSET
jgi:hypothetical protein